jgi:uracil-DNA glycosylase
MHCPAPPFAHSSGPRDAKIAIVGECWGEQEALIGKPFQGYSGQELTRMLQEAGISRRDCFLTNVLALRPPQNDVAALCGKKAEVGDGYTLPHLGKTGQYLRPEFLPELDRLRAELAEVKSNVVIALGATACWALLQTNGIGALRGTVATSSLLPIKVLPTYHPAGVLRNWAWRPIAVADLMKAKRESAFPEVRRPRRFILVNPTIDECWEWIDRHLGTECACDIETKFGMIEMIGFSANAEHAMVVPFWDRAKGGNYWPSPNIEHDARRIVRHILENSKITKIFQNGCYDLQYLLKEGYRPRGCREDTMLLHHALYPELQKGLGFLGSIYTSEPAWKLMRGKQITEMKKDD